MSKKRRDSRPSQQRVRTKGHLRSVPTAPADPEDQPLIDGFRRALRDESPTNLLMTVAGIMELVDESAPRTDGADLDVLVDSFAEIDIREMTAVLHVLAALTANELLEARIRKVLASRTQPLPGWIHDLPRVQVERTLLLDHPLADGDDYLLAVRLGSARFVMTVYVDYNLGVIVKDAFPGDTTIEELIGFMRANMEPDSRISEIDPADARTRITEAVTAGRSYPHPYESDTWGGKEALRRLDDQPLRDEPFDWTGIAEDIRIEISETLTQLTEHAEQLLDEEYLSAEKRLLHRLASADLDLFRGRASARVAAAAIVWMIARANDATSQYGPLTMQELLAPFGGTHSSDRVHAYLRVLGVAYDVPGELYLGSPDYLVADRRRELIEERDFRY